MGSSIKTSTILVHRLATFAGILALPALIAVLYQATVFSMPYLGKLAFGLSFFDAALAAWIVTRWPLNNHFRGWLTMFFAIVCFFIGWLFWSPVQLSLANQTAFTLIENGRLEIGTPIVHLLNLAICVWLFVPINLLMRRTLRRDNEIVDQHSIQISSMMSWTLGAALILTSISLIREYGEPYHIAHSANTAQFLLSFSILVISVSTTTVILFLSSTTWLRAILSFPVAIAVVFCGLKMVALITNTLAPNHVGSGNILNCPPLESLAVSIGFAMVLWGGIAWAKASRLEYIPNVGRTADAG